MKKSFYFLLILFGLLSFSSNIFAQQQKEDVVYLNNGSVYRGIIIEQIPNSSLKIQTIGGNIFYVEMSQVAKITKEDKLNMKPAVLVSKPLKIKAPKDTTSFVPRTKGYFFQGQIMLEAIQGGIHIINGYKFGRFGYLGIGVGFNNVLASPSDIFNNFNENGSYEDGYGGIYLPIYLYHQGDILKTKVTPFYAIEAGYALAFNKNFVRSGNSNYREGGVMAGAGIGVKFNNKRKKVHFSLLLNVNMKNVNYETDNYYFYDGFGNYTVQKEIRNRNLFFPGLRFGVGF